jgi:phage gp29-like protein
VKNIERIKNKVQNTPTEAKTYNAIKIPTQLFRITTDLSKYRIAVTAAENIYNPQRYTLYQLYQQTELDAQVTACIQQAKDLVLSCEFYVYNKDGSENDEKTKLIRQKWFMDYLDYAMDSIYWGHSLIQFEDIISLNGIDVFKEVELVPRMYVKPEYHMVMASTASLPPDGIDYLEQPYINWSISVGKSRDLGLFLKITPLVIWKKNAIGAWAEFIEKFGSPIRIGKTDSTDQQSVDNMEGMLRNMGVAAWGLFKTDDIIELVESTHSDAYEVFDKMIERCNSEIAKLILGQTGSTDEKSFVGSAEVHERMLQNVGYRIKQLIYSINNNQLIPMMNALGFGLDGCYIDIESEDEFNLEQKGKFDIELLKTGMYKFTPEYLKNKYGAEVMEVENSNEDATLVNYKDVLSQIYPD